MQCRIRGVLLLGLLIAGHGAELFRPWLGEGVQRCICNRQICICAHRKKAAHHASARPRNAENAAAASPAPAPRAACHSSKATGQPIVFFLESCDSEQDRALASFLYVLPRLQAEPRPQPASADLLLSASRLFARATGIDPPPPRFSRA